MEKLTVFHFQLQYLHLIFQRIVLNKQLPIVDSFTNCSMEYGYGVPHVHVY